MITTLILAAGRSTRMGQPKMLLPWGETTVLGQVVETIQRAGIADVLIVTGGARAEVESIAAKYGVQTIFNEGFASGEMLSSIQVGLRMLAPSLPPPNPQVLDSMQRNNFNTDLSLRDASRGEVPFRAEGALVVLGDQPQIEERSVRAVASQFAEARAKLVVPSYQMRRGHPWLVASLLWDEILAMRENESPRDFLNRHASEIEYVTVDNPSILADLDTPDDYLKSRP